MAGGTITIKPVELPLSAADAVGLAELLVDAVDSGAAASFLAPLTPDEAATRWRATLAGLGTRGLALVAGDGDEIIGSVLLVPAWAPNQASRADVAKLLVHRRARRQGVGTRLMREVEAEAQRRGFRLLTLDTRRGSDADRLYQRLGWTSAGTIPRFALDPDGVTWHDATLYYKDLALLKAPATETPRTNPGVTPAGEAIRRFQIVDGLILVLAVALDLGLIRAVVMALTAPGPGLPSRRLPGWATTLIVVVVTWMVGTLTWLVLRLTRPRPTLRDLATRPGFVACTTAALILALNPAVVGLVAAIRPLFRADAIPPSWWFSSLRSTVATIGPAVGAAWILLALSGQRRPQRNAFDITGRILGVGWVVLFVIAVVARVVFDALV